MLVKGKMLQGMYRAEMDKPPDTVFFKDLEQGFSPLIIYVKKLVFLAVNGDQGSEMEYDLTIPE
jgi:hypothetical protein